MYHVFVYEGCNVQSVNFTYTRDGRPSGEAYVELSSEGDVQQALSKNQQHMGKRYIEGMDVLQIF
jgi:heterogeneous nuclear ribonucleoprotein F/H